MARIRGDSLRTGMKYSYNRLQGAPRHLQAALVKQDYLAASVKLISANYDASTNRADITFQATSGNIVKVRAVGAHIWTRTMHNLVPMYQEGTVNDELITEGPAQHPVLLSGQGLLRHQSRCDCGEESGGHVDHLRHPQGWTVQGRSGGV